MSELQRVGRYQIQSELGRGGMATVYLAYDPQFNRQVAVKVLPRQYLHDPSFLQRFYQEAQVIARLEHHRILPVYDFGEADGIPFIVMRYMPQRSLRDRLAGAGNNGLPLPEVVRLAQQVAEALDFAHRHGVIHRDLKPDNVLLDESGNTFLSDFGIAKVIEASISFSSARSLGTPHYMAPEQVRGGVTTARTDVYALGCMCFELLAGRPPYQAPDAFALGYLHVNEPIPQLGDFRPATPPGLQAVIQRAMAKKPDDRFSSAAELVQALAAATQLAANQHQPAVVPRVYQTGQVPQTGEQPLLARQEVYITMNAPAAYVPEIPAAAPPQKPPENLRAPAFESPAGRPAAARAKKRFPPWGWLLVAGLVLACGLSSLYLVARGLPGLSLFAPAPGGNLVADSQTPGADSQPGAGDPTSAPPVDSCDMGNFITDVTIPDDIPVPPGETFVKTWRLQNTGSCTWTDDYALVFYDGDDLAGPAAIPLASDPVAPGQMVDLSVTLTAPTEPGTYQGNYRLRTPQGEIFGLGENRDLSLFFRIQVPDSGHVAATGFTYSVQSGDTCGSIAAAFGLSIPELVEANNLPSDCSGLAVGQELIIPELLQKIYVPGSPESGLDFSPDGSQLAVSTYTHDVILFEVESGRQVFNQHVAPVADTDTGHGILSVAISPDGRWLASGGSDGRLTLWNAQSGQQVAVLETREDMLDSLSWSPDSAFLAAAGWDEVLNIWEITSQSLWASLNGREVAWSPDGSTLAAGSYATVALWNFPTLSLKNSWQAHQGAISTLAWSPDGALLASGSCAPEVRIWDATTGQEVSSIRACESEITDLAFSPDGAWLATGSNDRPDGTRIWRASTWELVHVQDGHAVAWSPSGDLLASSSYWDWIYLWRP